jgi:hypothetical protein
MRLAAIEVRATFRLRRTATHSSGDSQSVTNRSPARS